MIAKQRLLVTVAIISGCTTATAYYQPPAVESTPPRSSFERTIAVPYDQVWEAIIDHVSEGFFAIESFEKDSGLITLSFGSSRPDVYVDCGQWKSEKQRALNASVSQETPYVVYLKGQFGGSLDGRLNISARAVSPTATRVRVNARYVVSSLIGTWSFDSGSTGTLGSRTCVPTGEVEGAILRGIEAIVG